MVPLTDAKESAKCRVMRIMGGKGAILRLSELGVYEGAVIIAKRTGAGPVLIQVLDSTIALGRGLAQKIQVEEIG